MSANEQTRFLGAWEHEAQLTLKLLRALPPDQYEFRPDREGRSLGECAWHLAEIDAFITDGVVNGKLDFSKKIPGLERPRTIAELAPGYERVHKSCVAQIQALEPEGIDKQVSFMGNDTRAGDLLWYALLHHLVHHRGQLVLLTRLAGGKPVGMYGPIREEMAAMKAGAN